MRPHNGWSALGFNLARLVHVHRRAEAAEDAAELRHLNHQWHLALREAAHNTTIAELMARLDDRLRVYDTGTSELPDNLELIFEEHTRILDAVRRGDAEAAREEMIGHQSRTRDLRIAALAQS